VKLFASPEFVLAGRRVSSFPAGVPPAAQVRGDLAHVRVGEAHHPIDPRNRPGGRGGGCRDPIGGDSTPVRVRGVRIQENGPDGEARDGRGTLPPARGSPNELW